MSGRLLSRLRLRHKVLAGLAVVGLAAGLTVLPSSFGSAQADIAVHRSSLQGTDGKQYWVDNHIEQREVVAARKELRGKRPEYLLVWAGDANIADTIVPDIKHLPGLLNNTVDKVRNALPGPDFMAVIDVTKGSPSYGKVVNTATVGPLVENEPHHMQYVWHKGDKIFAGGLYSAVTYVFDVAKLPALSLSGISLPTATACGSVPDAYWTLKDGTAMGTYMGGPVAPGPCRYTHGEVRSGNGFAGTPGEVIRFGKHGEDLVQAPAATNRTEDPKWCDDLPTLQAPSCANPHGIQAREDLHTMVTSDYAEPRNIILDPVKAPSAFLRRSSIRTWDISDLNHPKVKSVSFLQPGPRAVRNDPLHWENRAIMETTVTNRPGHKGAFAQSMQGGAVYYAPDITVDHPQWREVLDDWAGDKLLQPGGGVGAGDNAGWIQTSPDDKTVYHAIVGRQKGTLGPSDPGTTGGVLAIDVEKLVDAGPHAKCEINTVEEARNGGHEDDCPRIRSVVPINPGTPAGGPHWGALDNFKIGHDGYYHETDQPARIATSNYFVARTGLDGDHKVCMIDIDHGKMHVDRAFRDEITGQECVSFNRKNWPHGAFGFAKPHAILFVTADEDVK